MCVKGEQNQFTAILHVYRNVKRVKLDNGFSSIMRFALGECLERLPRSFACIAEFTSAISFLPKLQCPGQLRVVAKRL